MKTKGRKTAGQSCADFLGSRPTAYAEEQDFGAAVCEGEQQLLAAL